MQEKNEAGGWVVREALLRTVLGIMAGGKLGNRSGEDGGQRQWEAKGSFSCMCHLLEGTTGSANGDAAAADANDHGTDDYS